MASNYRSNRRTTNDSKSFGSSKSYNRSKERDEDESGDDEESDGEERSSSRRSSGRSEGKKFRTTRLGSLTFTKSVDEDAQEDIKGLLQETEAKMWLKVYLPKDIKSVTLRNDDKILINFKKPEKRRDGGKPIPDFVVGQASLPEDEE